jgi:hypothetical protein
MLQTEDFAEFQKRARQYGAIGLALNEISGLEYEIDQFMLEVIRSDNSLATTISQSFPRQFDKKIKFIAQLVPKVPKLMKVISFGDGSVETQWLEGELSFLFEVRRTLSHGVVDLVTQHEGFSEFRLRHVMKSTEVGSWTVKVVEVGEGFLADVAETANHFAGFFRILREAWNDNFDPEIEIEIQREIDSSWVSLEQFAESQGLSLSELLKLKIWTRPQDPKESGLS